MKIVIMTIFVLISVLLISACVRKPAMEETVCGGWSSASENNKNVIAAATFAVNAEEKILREKSGSETSQLELIAVQEAAQQVVAGVNYRLKLKVKLDGRQKTAETVVWWQSWREPSPYQLISWKWD